MSEQEAMTVNEKFNFYVSLGWRYIPDPETWSGGVWNGDEKGYVTNGGGSFPHINAAVAAMERFLEGMEMISDD